MPIDLTEAEEVAEAEPLGFDDLGEARELDMAGAAQTSAADPAAGSTSDAEQDELEINLSDEVDTAAYGAADLSGAAGLDDGFEIDTEAPGAAPLETGDEGLIAGLDDGPEEQWMVTAPVGGGSGSGLAAGQEAGDSQETAAAATTRGGGRKWLVAAAVVMVVLAGGAAAAWMYSPWHDAVMGLVAGEPAESAPGIEPVALADATAKQPAAGEAGEAGPPGEAADEQPGADGAAAGEQPSEAAAATPDEQTPGEGTGDAQPPEDATAPAETTAPPETSQPEAEKTEPAAEQESPAPKSKRDRRRRRGRSRRSRVRGSAAQHYRLAAGYYRQKKISKAIDELKKALTISPRDARSLRLLGMAYMSAGNKKVAVQVFEKFLKVAPGHKDAPKIRKIVADYRKHNK